MQRKFVSSEQNHSLSLGIPLERNTLILSALGFALCISAPEASRYSALWHINDSGSLPEVALKAGYLLLCFFIVRLVSKKSMQPLYLNRPLLIVLPVLQTIGFILLIMTSLGLEMPGWAGILRSLLLESSYFLFVLFASLFLKTNLNTAITTFVAGVVIAGTIQVCLAFLPFFIASSCVLAFAPVSSLLLFLSAKQIEADKAWYSSLPEHERDVFKNSTQSTLSETTLPKKPRLNEEENTVLNLQYEPFNAKNLYIAITLLSFIVAAIHLQWVGIQDGQTASLLVQICAGVGSILAGNILLAVRRNLESREMVDFIRMLVLPVAIGTLYFTSLLSGSLLALSVIPLNIVYITVLLLTWIAPFLYAQGRASIDVSCKAFLAKRLGVVVGIGLMRDLSIDGFGWMEEVLIIMALAGLIITSAIQYYYAQKRSKTNEIRPIAQINIDSEEARKLACASVANRFRLTPRECEVLELLVKGRTANYIAETLIISSTTAKTHIKHIYQKFGVQSK